MGKQMSSEWVEGNIKRMLESKNQKVVETGRILNEAIQTNPNSIRRKINVLGPDGVNRWNVVNIP